MKFWAWGIRDQSIKGGTVVDIDYAENAIRSTVHAAENMAAEP